MPPRGTDVDDAFADMGEYQGWVNSTSDPTGAAKYQLGLQVVALGDNRFRP